MSPRSSSIPHLRKMGKVESKEEKYSYMSAPHAFCIHPSTMSPKVSTTYSVKSKSKNLISSKVPYLIHKLSKFAMSHGLGITHLGCNSSLWNSETQEPVVCSQIRQRNKHNLKVKTFIFKKQKHKKEKQGVFLKSSWINFIRF